MARVRRYQLANPEPATEAMNRLAQALCCLSDPATKRAYDASLGLVSPAAPEPKPEPPPPAPAVPPEPAPLVVAETSTAPVPADPLAWLFGPWNPTPPAPPAPAQEIPWSQLEGQAAAPPVRLDVAPPASAAVVETATAPAGATVQANVSAADVPVVEGTDALVDAVRSSPVARRGLSTKRALYYRVTRTRQLLWAWDRVGRYLGDPGRAVTRQAEANDLVRQLQIVRSLLRSFPPILGEAGQPGNYVLTLARQPDVLAKFQKYLPAQRETLARDWNDARALLLAHRAFLRQELRAMRRSGSFRRAARVVAAHVREHSGRVLFFLAGLALYLSSPMGEVLWRGDINRFWWMHLFLFVAGVVGVNVFLWWDVLATPPPHPVRPAAPPPRLRPRPRVQRQPNQPA
jgi:hypothetical protein